MNTDDTFDEWLIQAARDYNTPPDAIPREAMWEAIHSTAAAGARLPVALQPPITSTRLRVTGVWRWGGLAAAAALLLIAGYQLGRRSDAPSPSVSAAPMGQVQGGTALYDRAAELHLGRADALLTSVRSMVDAGEVDDSIKGWARTLLADTRLLIDSPAANDPARRRLLRDLELTLAQISQLSDAVSADDQQLVERSLQRGELLTRIRTTAPSVLSGT